MDKSVATKAGFLRRRGVGLFLALILLIASYAVLVKDFYRESPAIDGVFQEKGSGAIPPLDVYLEILSVDPIRQAVEVRLDFAVKSGPGGLQFGGAPDADMVVRVRDGTEAQDIQLKAGAQTSSAKLDLDVRGAFENYPFDQYDGTIGISAFEGPKPDGAAAVRVRLITWEELARWEVAVSESSTGVMRSGLSVSLLAKRPSAQIFFALVLYGAMILLAATALTIGSLVFLGLRKVESTLMGALGATVFAVPAIRNVLPDAPPLGVRADAYVFLWVQLAVILGLILFVTTWARSGPGAQD